MTFPVRASLIALAVAAVLWAGMMTVAVLLTPADAPEAFGRVAMFVTAPVLVVGLLLGLVGPRAGLRAIFGPLERGDYATALRRLEHSAWLGFPVAGFRAGVLLDAGEIDAAEAIYVDLLSGSGPYWSKHATSLAAVMMARGRHGDAARWLARARAHQPDYPWAHLRLAELDLVRGVVDDATLEELDRAIQLAPAEGRAWFVDENPIAEAYASRAWALATLGRGDEARAELGLALGMVHTQRFQPGRAAVCLRAARALVALGDRDAALTQATVGASIDPGRAGQGCAEVVASLTAASGTTS